MPHFSHTSLRPALSWMILAILGASQAYAQEEDIPDRFPVFLQVFINGRDTEMVGEFEQDFETGEVFGTREELRDVGLKLPLLGPNMVAFSDLDQVRFEHDEFAQSVSFYAPHSALLPTVLSARKEKPLENPDDGYGAVLNYDFSARSIHRSDEASSAHSYSLGLDARAFAPWGVLKSSGSLDVNSEGEARFTRLSTSFEHDDMERGVSYIAGDVTSSSPAWGRSVRLGGIQIKRNFGLRSDLIDGPQLSFDGTAQLASTVDVYIENNRVYTGTVHEGPFRVEDVPTTTPSGEAVIVLREENGETKVSEVPFFAGNNLLKKGVVEYSLEAGVARLTYGSASSHYGDDLATFGSIRYGLTDKFTLHGHFESVSDLLNVSGGISSTIGKWAEYTFAGGYSDHGGTKAHLGYWSLDVRLGSIDLEASVLRSSEGYADLAMINGINALDGMPATDQMTFPSVQDVFSIGLPLPSTERRLNMSYVSSERGSQKDRIISAGLGFDLFGGNASLNISGSYELTRSSARVGALFQMPLGKSHNLRANLSGGSGGMSSEISVSKPIEQGVNKAGYEAHFTKRRDSIELVASAQFQHRYGKVSGHLRSHADETLLEARAQGSVVIAGGKMAFAPRIEDAFAIVDVGEPNVDVELQHITVSRTDWTGRAVVTGLDSYRENRVSIDANSLPEGSSLGITAATIVPARGAGVLITMSDQESVSSKGEALVTVRLSDGRPAPLGSEISANDGIPVPVGYEGLTWLTGLRSENSFSLTGTDYPCSGSFSFTPTDDIQQQIEIACD